MEEINFVNRVEELHVLLERIAHSSDQSTITFLRAPSGYGKSSLTDRLIEVLPEEGPTCIVVDPSIRSKSRSDRIYGWFFVQRAAEPTAIRRNKDKIRIQTFAEFLRWNQYSKINWKHAYENLKESASLSKIIKLAIEFFENVLKIGRYSPQSLLQDDSVFSTRIAQEYIAAIAAKGSLIFIIRECQNIDPESLRFFLTLGEQVNGIAVVLEYTTSDGKFSPEHEKIILDAITDKTSLIIFDLLRLGIEEFRLLLQKHVTGDKHIEAAVELYWDGNLRIIRELKYRVMIGNLIDVSGPLQLETTIKQNVDLLSKRKRAILAIVTSHIEAIRTDVLFSVLKQIDATVTLKKLKSDLEQLDAREKYIQADIFISLANEDLMEAVSASNKMKPLLNLAEIKLRDFYLNVVRGEISTGLSLQAALRQAIALCAKTKDVVALQGLINILDSSVLQALDQTLYINIVAGAIASFTDLSPLERKKLLDWTITAAYEVSDFPTAASLLESSSDLNHHDIALLACCYGEMNRHVEALKLAESLRKSAKKERINVIIVAKLIECAALFALGRKTDAEKVHNSLRFNDRYVASPLYGYILRYTEIIMDFPECISDVLQSAEIFRENKFLKSAAYSQLAGAVHLAYKGANADARKLITDAQQILLPFIRDRQIILNNTVVVELLTPNPDLDYCLDQLNSALFTVKDEFYRLALHNNRLICFWLKEDYSQAIHSAEVIEDILADPKFGNRDVFWTVCFNVCSFFDEIGDTKKSQRFKLFLSDLDLEDSCLSGLLEFPFWIKLYR